MMASDVMKVGSKRKLQKNTSNLTNKVIFGRHSGGRGYKMAVGKSLYDAKECLVVKMDM